jgi:hypothetical protein
MYEFIRQNVEFILGASGASAGPGYTASIPCAWLLDVLAAKPRNSAC